MKKTIYLFMLILLSGCTQKQAEIEAQYAELIIGDWTTNQDESALVFTFKDSTCSYLYAAGALSPYKIEGDTLTINEKVRKRGIYSTGGREAYIFMIDSLTKDVFHLKPIGKAKDLIARYDNQYPERIELSRIKKKNEVDIQRIGFYSTMCFGSCPAMYLEIDSARNFFFRGDMYTDKEGSFSGKISMAQYERIQNKVNNIELDSLELFYAANWTDDQTCGICIQTNEKMYESNAYGYYKEPATLRILFHELMELYKEVELNGDTTLRDKLRFYGFQFNANLP